MGFQSVGNRITFGTDWKSRAFKVFLGSEQAPRFSRLTICRVFPSGGATDGTEINSGCKCQPQCKSQRIWVGAASPFIPTP